jgi:galactokinase/mevalonate kinase-like predicted kinase
MAAAGLNSAADIQESALFPIIRACDLDGGFIQWLVDREPARNEAFSAAWLNAERLSARQIAARVNLKGLYAQRAKLRSECLLPMWENFRSSVFFRLDLESTARTFAATSKRLPDLDFTPQDDPMQLVHDRMFRSAIYRHRGDAKWKRFEAAAFGELQTAIVREGQLAPALPRRNVQEDQIVWARSPVRLDLAGGWTDTPPYCLENGGRVLNVAVDLNGQPPIQVFAKLSEKPELVIRSIDLGLEKRIRSYEELDSYAQPGSPFALPKAALALAGFLPCFHAKRGCKSLQAQLAAFGGGIELSLLSAVPKGSGLGTSSILAATVLAALGDLCGLNWDRNILFTRTLALEQMLTTGGGWQDQAGAIFRGVKMIETSPGLAQRPTLRWLPTHLLDRDYANRSVLLYYTGITRLAKNILSEIVRGLFLNSPSHLHLLHDIGQNALFAAEAMQKCDYDLLSHAIRNSWRLNKRLDSGTNPPEVQRILDRIAGLISAVKLLGAGGGGYLLMFAKDETAASRIRKTLGDKPPNDRARFVDFAVSESGLQLTRS